MQQNYLSSKEELSTLVSMATSEKPPNAETRSKDAWDKWESFSKIFAAIGIPVVLGVGSWLIQATLAKQSVSKDYVTDKPSRKYKGYEQPRPFKISNR